jgi:ABC-type transport system involved in multi-copper enzyme maturation permease subunit
MSSTVNNAALRRFQPLAALVRRELLTTLRLRRTWFAMAVLVFILSVFAEDQFPSGEYSLNVMAQQSRTFFVFMVMGLYMSCLMFVPGLAATAVTVERERQTYDLVRTSLLTPLAFITGKLLNALGVFLLLIVAALPLLGFVFFMVGVDVYAITAATAITFSTAFALAAAGLMCSVVMRSTVRAVTASYVCMIFIMGIHIGIGAMILGIIFRSAAMFQSLSFMVFMVPAFVLGRTIAGTPLLEYAAATTGYLIVLGLIFMFIACFRFVRDIKRDETPMLATPLRLPWRRKRVAFESGPGEIRTVPEGMNAVFWGEYLAGRAGSNFYRRTVLFGLLFLLPAFLFIVSLFIEGAPRSTYASVALGWFIAVAAVTGLIVTASSANLFTRDIDRGNLDFLRTTLCSNSEILVGKALAGLLPCAPILIAAVMASIPFWLAGGMGETMVVNMLGGYLMLIMTVLTALFGAMAASAWARRTTTAIAMAFGLNSMIFFGFAFTGALGISLGMRSWQQPEFALFLMMPSPILSFAPGGFIAQSEFGGMASTDAFRLYFGLAAACVQLLLIAVLIVVTQVGLVRRGRQE